MREPTPVDKIKTRLDDLRSEISEAGSGKADEIKALQAQRAELQDRINKLHAEAKSATAVLVARYEEARWSLGAIDAEAAEQYDDLGDAVSKTSAPPTGNTQTSKAEKRRRQILEYVASTDGGLLREDIEDALNLPKDKPSKDLTGRSLGLLVKDDKLTTTGSKSGTRYTAA